MPKNKNDAVPIVFTSQGLLSNTLPNTGLQNNSQQPSATRIMAAISQTKTLLLLKEIVMGLVAIEHYLRKFTESVDWSSGLFATEILKLLDFILMFPFSIIICKVCPSFASR